MSSSASKAREKTARDQFVWDVFVAALEGGIGYWSQAESYHIWVDGEASKGEDVRGFYADIIEIGDGDIAVKHRITRTEVELGMERILRQDRGCAVSDDFWMELALQWTRKNYDAGEIDADRADMIVQVGLFDELRYG